MLAHKEKGGNTRRCATQLAVDRKMLALADPAESRRQTLSRNNKDENLDEKRSTQIGKL
jgi:hypothetical protein